MKCYRLSKAEYAEEPLSGHGSFLAGQRWNSKGTHAAYTSSSPAACLLEAMLHVHDDGFPVGWRMLEVELPDDSIEILASRKYPDHWDEFPYRRSVQAIGDEWAASQRSLVLAVSSAIDKTSTNYIINPKHSRFVEIPKPRDITARVDLARIAERLRAAVRSR